MACGRGVVGHPGLSTEQSLRHSLTLSHTQTHARTHVHTYICIHCVIHWYLAPQKCKVQKHTARTLIGKRFFLINFFFLFKKERGGYIYTHAHALINACIHEGTGRPFKRFQSALYHHLARAPCLATSTKQCLGKGFAPPIFAPSLLLSPLPQLSQARHQLGKV